MAPRCFILAALCITLLIVTSLGSGDETARDLFEHVLRIPDPDRVLNSVLGILERSRQQARSKLQTSEQEDCDEPSEILPEYTETIGSRERDLRQLGVQKHYPICHLERKIRKLNTNEYEYRPAYYEEVKCVVTKEDDIGVTSERLLGNAHYGDPSGLRMHVACSQIGRHEITYITPNAIGFKIGNGHWPALRSAGHQHN